MSTEISPEGFSIRRAQIEDCALILELILELAEYEQLLSEVEASPELLRQNLFGDKSRAEVIIGEVSGRPVGYALFFPTFSTFTGKTGIYLEDIYVRPDWRKQGFGKALLQYVASVAIAQDCGRLEWAVLDWNEPALTFYRKLGAEPLSEWTGQRLTGQSLSALAKADIRA